MAIYCGYDKKCTFDETVIAIYILHLMVDSVTPESMLRSVSMGELFQCRRDIRNGRFKWLDYKNYRTKEISRSQVARDIDSAVYDKYLTVVAGVNEERYLLSVSNICATQNNEYVALLGKLRELKQSYESRLTVVLS